MTEYPLPDNGVIAIATVSLVFLIHRYSFTSGVISKRFKYRPGDPDASIRRILYKRLLGALLFGLLPALVLKLVIGGQLSRYGISGVNLGKSILWWIPVAAVLTFLACLMTRSRKHLELYPQIRTGQWTLGLLTASAMSWILYLAGYELLFRGFLLFSCLESFGFWPAIILNVSLYALVHLDRGAREAFGTLLFGFLLCYPTLLLGSCWFAVFVHITVALSNEWLSLASQPGMKLIRNKQQI